MPISVYQKKTLPTGNSPDCRDDHPTQRIKNDVQQSLGVNGHTEVFLFKDHGDCNSPDWELNYIISCTHYVMHDCMAVT